MIKILSFTFTIILLLLMVFGWYSPWQVTIVKEGLSTVKERLLHLYRCMRINILIEDVYDGPKNKLGIVIRNKGIKVNKSEINIYYDRMLIKKTLNGTLEERKKLNILVDCKEAWACDCSDGFSGERIEVCTGCGGCDWYTLTDHSMYC